MALQVLSEDGDHPESPPHLQPRLTLQEDLQLGVAHGEGAAPGAVVLGDRSVAVLQDVLREAASVLGDAVFLPLLAHEANLARAVGLAAVGNVAGTQQLLCGHREGDTGSPLCPPASFGGFGDGDIVLKTPEPRFDSLGPSQDEGKAAQCGESTLAPPGKSLGSKSQP